MTSQKPCKVCKNGKMTSQKCCKVCKNANWPVTTMSSQRFGVPKTQYVCHFFLTLHSLWAPSDFFCKNTTFELYRLRRHSLVLLGFASFCVLRVGLAWFGVGNLPAYRAWVMMTVRLHKANSLKLQLINIVYYILHITYYTLYITY